MNNDLNYKEIKWLEKNGDRTFDDVLEDEKGLYVLMYSPYYFNFQKKVYFRKVGRIIN